MESEFTQVVEINSRKLVVNLKHWCFQDFHVSKINNDDGRMNKGAT